ncbi:glycosyltransferase family 1 protein [Sporolactobacillus sp. THM19-2]|uniref:glycosyltransferase family 4 protein n=1 Tax=Sporolactobacillus sp. THM19-2 TaxID=2511171 RepID=UPI00101EF020|nr:glycosyltransferase family 1 protein [Sporolactobacillus sp. THM19-2]RYL93934.1 glycosyltransferase family 1 protein [Sporolactobacillus sp. THM19-2]
MEMLTNATICDKRPTGLGVYTINVIKEINKRENINQEILVNKLINVDHSFYKNDVIYTPNYILSSNGWLAQLARIIYLNCFLPKIGRDKDLIFNPVPEGSLFLNHQVTVIHDILPLLFKREYPKSYYYYKYYVPRLLKKSYKVIVPSNNTKKDIIRVYNIDNDKIIVAPNGYDNKHFFQRNDDEVNNIKTKYGLSKYILYVGNMYPHKNLERLIQAFCHIHLKFPEIKLVLVGDTKHWNFNNLVKLVDSLGLSNSIYFLDYVSYQELPSLYGGALAFVYPSLYEGFGLPIIEAMACGTPVITSNTSSLREIAGNCALTVNPIDIKEIESKISKIIVNTELRELYRKRGLKRALEYDWGKTVDKILSQLPSKE